jgi:hypothetical protein
VREDVFLLPQEGDRGASKKRRPQKARTGLLGSGDSPDKLTLPLLAGGAALPVLMKGGKARAIFVNNLLLLQKR